MRKPKLRELKEALRAVFTGPYTGKFPFEPHVPPDGFRGKPQFSEKDCVGCGACAEVCPALAIRVTDDSKSQIPMRRFELRYDKCVFCGQCQLNCITKTGIELTKIYDLATLDRSQCVERVQHELVICEVCGAVIAARKHLQWVAEQIGAKAYANPTLVVTADGSMRFITKDAGRKEEPALARSDMMRMTCPDCRRTIVVRELWGE